MIARRGVLLAACAACASLGARRASALGRTPLGGKVRLSVPYAIGLLDPHDVMDPIAAIFAHAVFDTLVVHDKRGFTPGLVEALPEREAGAVVVRLRAGLRTAAGKSLDARDVVSSLKRARARGAAALLDPLGPPAVSPKDPLTVLFTKGSPATAIVALASPLTAIVPRDFDPRAPDGTGAFAATLKPKELALGRNGNAALGPSFLERVTVSEASDLRDSIRDFEVGRQEVGWLGGGVAGGRADAESFDLGPVATFALVASATAGPLAKPGALQKLIDDVPRVALAHLGLGVLPSGSSSASYDGPPLDLWVEPSAHHVEIAESLAAALSAPGHELRVRKAPRDEIGRRRSRGDTMLSLHAARPLGSASLSPAALVSLLEDPSRTTLTGKGTSLRDAARSTRVAVIGDLRVAGGKSKSFAFTPHPKGGFDLSGSRTRRKT